MSDRYFVPEEICSDRVTLRGTEAHHLLHVMRADVGTSVTLFDGSGTEFSAVVERRSRTEVELAVVSRNLVDRELPDVLTLAVALPKGDRARWLVEKTTEIGVSRLIPLVSGRGVAQPVEATLKRLRRTVVEASKQCGRNRLMRIEDPLTWSEFVAAQHDSTLRLVAHPGLSHAATPLGKVAWNAGPALLAVGPEGGFTDEEIELALEYDWRTVDLGPRILRVETAAVAAVSYLAISRGRVAGVERSEPPESTIT